MKNFRHKAFTLIEMLIVIVIIGILAAAVIPRLQSIQSRARDTKRKVDLSTLSKAVEIYYTDNNKYPAPDSSYLTCGYNTEFCYALSSYTGLWLLNMTGYVTSLPIDPINNAGYQTPYGADNRYNYAYGTVFTSPHPSVYYLYTQLETKNDPDNCIKKPRKVYLPFDRGGYTQNFCSDYGADPDTYILGVGGF